MAAMTVLTRDEAQARAQLLDVHSYDIDLDLTRGAEHFRSITVIRFSARAGGDTFVDIRPAALLSASLDGRGLDVTSLDDNRLPLTSLTPGDHELRVEADMSYSRTGEGMHRFTDPADGETYLWSQMFLEDVQRVFAAFDQPDLKAVFTSTVTAPPEWTVLGNTVATRVGPPADGRWQLPTTLPLSTYFVAFAAGPWHTVRTEHAGLPFALHCRRSLAAHLDADAEELFDITRRCFDRFHEIFDEPYPFDSYDQAFVPEFNPGAMENPGLVTFRDEYVFRSAATDTERQNRAITMAHEMAHMWFGDLVTLRWWDDIWLNESFAEYMGYQVLTEAMDFTGPWAEFGISRKAWGSDADQRETTHPVAPDADAVRDTGTALLNFDGISYAKGAGALRQLVAWMGEKDFLAGINDHFARHRFGNATLADFIDSLSRASDRDVHAWARQWLRTTGVDTLTPRIDTTADGHWRLTVDHEGTRPHRIAVGLYDQDPREPGRLTARERTESTSPRPHRYSAARAPGPPSSSSTTATSPTPRFAWTPPPTTPSYTASPACPTPSPAPSSGTPSATWSATAGSPPTSTSKPPAPTSRTRPTTPSSRASSPSPTPRSPTSTSPPTAATTPSPSSATPATTSCAARRTAPPRASASPPCAPSSPAAPPPAPSTTGSAPGPSPAAPPSTPNSAGASSPASPPSAPSLRRTSTPNSPATPAPPARRAPHAAAPRSPTPPPRKRPGTPSTTATPSPPTSGPPRHRASGSTDNSTSPAPTGTATTPTSRHSPPVAAPPSPPPPATMASPVPSSTTTPCASVRSA